jgi:hypothetical protein
MSIHRCLKVLSRAGLAAALAFAAGPARADCDANGNTVSGTDFCFHIVGSDTLFDIMTQAINAARTSSNPAVAAAANDLFYQGGGSGTAETALTTPASSTDLGTESIGPMSRNFRPAFIDPGDPSFIQRSSTTLTNTGHRAWAPTVRNVVGLDAAVFVFGGSAGLNDIAFPTETEQPPPPATFNGQTVPIGVATQKAVRNNAGLPANYASSAAFNNLASTVNYSSLMMTILGGVDGSGTLAACADVRRARAVADLAAAVGVTTLEHLYRRDDASGTTDTFKDRVIVVPNVQTPLRYASVGGRFCNGAAPGNTVAGICSIPDASGIYQTCSSGLFGGEAVCPAGAQFGVCLYNRSNQDLDPIRRSCSVANAPAPAGGFGPWPTTCTDYVAGLPCSYNDGNPNCSQGLIVGLSDTDRDTRVPRVATDVTLSIAERVAQGGGLVLGYAGRTSVDPDRITGTKAPSINGLLASPENTRANQYLLARKLFVQFSGNGVDMTASPFYLDSPILLTSGGSDRKTREKVLFDGFISPNPAGSRLPMDNIVNGLGFISCLDPNDPAYGLGDPTGTGTLCDLSPHSPVVGALSAVAGGGASGLAAKVAKTIKWNGSSPAVVTTGTVTSGWQNFRLCTSAAPCSCSGTEPCLSSGSYTTPTCANSTQMTCTSSSLASCTSAAVSMCETGRCSAGACTLGNVNVVTGAAESKPLDAPCTADTECTSGFCRDRYGFGAGAQARGRVCCAASDPVCTAAPPIAAFP